MDRQKLTFKTIGCDPELFLIERITGQPFSAEGIVPGTKDEPHYISTKGHMIQLDNVLVEFGTPPATNVSDFKEHIHYILSYLRSTYGDRFDLGQMASTELDPIHLQTENSQLIACDPDYDCWTFKVNESSGFTSNMRSAGK